MITVRQVCKSVTSGEGVLHILKDINLEVADAESIAIVGESGAGKSTLLSLLAGLDTPTSGQIWLAGVEITAMDEEQRAKVRAEHVGFVFQTFQLLPALTALENVALPLELQGRRNATETAKQYLDRVGLTPRLTHYPRQLSGGEQQRVALARAFATQPHILFADEPTGNLDTKTGQRITDLLFELNAEEGTTLVLVTHEQRLAERCGHRVQMSAGELRETL
jgi:putative ABC transport system ATP-binding protein